MRQFLDGQLDEWRVYARALSQAEIQQVMDLPGASFIATPRQGFAPLAVTFSNSSTHTTTYLWDFGDGSPASTEVNPLHTYTQPGVYTVTLQASDGMVTDTLTRPAYIQATTLDQGLQGHWRLDEESGARADSSPNANHLAEYNTVASTPGQVGLAADFEASNQEYLAIDDSIQSGLAITGGLTLAGWARLESTSSDFMILASKYEYGVNNRAYRFDVQPDGKPRLIISPDGTYSSGDHELVANTPLITGTWHHVAGIFDAQAQTLALYLDGEPVGSRWIAYDHIYRSTAPFMLGANLNNGSVTQYFDGALDEWRVYDRPLSQAEIQALRATSPPAAGFIATPLSGSVPLTVTFTNATSGAATYLWDFGDGGTSTLVSPMHPYTAAGVYTVSLTADGPGGSDTLTRTDYITATSTDESIAGLAATNDSPTALGGVTALTATVTAGSHVTYTWAFGDGETGDGAVVTHTYPATGDYTAVVTASNPVGWITATTSVMVTGTPALTISKVGPATAVAGEPITYTLIVTNVGGASASNLVITDAIPSGAGYASGGTRVGDVVSWTFGLLPNTASTQFSFIVTATGTITNSDYRVTADGGISATGQVVVVTAISQPLTADFVAEPLSGTVPLTVTFTNLSTPTELITGTLWAYGDGITSTTTALTHPYTYTQAGVYTVSLTVYGAGESHTRTQSNYITVTKSLTADFSAEPLSGAVPLTVTFTNLSTPTGLITSTLWTYGDGVISTTTALTHPHTYTQAGVYSVSLTVSDGLVTDTLTRSNYITVTQPVTYPTLAWWDDDFFFRRQMTLSVATPITYTPGVTTVLAITLDTETLVDEEKLRADGSDLRVVYWDTSTGWRELPRAIAGMNAPTSTIRFPLQTTITATDESYYLYYGNWLAGPPPWLAAAAGATPGVSYGVEETPVATAIFEPGVGGVLTSAGGDLAVHFPAAAVTQTLVVTHTPYRARVDQGPDQLQRFELLARTPAGASVENFAAPVTLTLAYAGLGVAPEDEETILFFYWDEAASDWQPITTTINTAGDLATASVDHFTQFAVAQHFGLGGPPPLRRLPTVSGAGVDLLTGAATYVYPLEVPPGTHGMLPNLNLVYNSGAADTLLDQQAGLVGHGFELAGLGYVQLNPDDDHYYLNLNGMSEKLIEVAPGDYRTEHETGWQIKLLSGGQNGVDDAYWLVTTQDKTQFRFGFYPESSGHYIKGARSQTEKRVYLYHLDRVQDVYSNTMSIAYDEETVSQGSGPARREYELAVWPTVISYTTNALAGSLQPTRKITFIYSPTYVTDENDRRADFPPQEETGPRQRYGYPQAVDRIQIQVEGSPVREYKLNYTYYKQQDKLNQGPPYGPQHYHLMLTGITEYDGGGQLSASHVAHLCPDRPPAKSGQWLRRAGGVRI